MAPAISCLLAAAVVAVAAARTPAEQLARILQGDVSKDELEIVLAQHNEDVAWSDEYSKLRTVYCKGSAACAPDAVPLDNVGREGHTYLSHIVNNYDKLADWTIFSQAGEPTLGYKGQNQGGGHMLSGASFSDYLVHPYRAGVEDPEAFFLMTSKVHLPTLNHALRSSYKVADGQSVPQLSSLPPMCPALKTVDTSSDDWNSYEDIPWLRSFVSDKCGVEEHAVGDAMLMFWDSFVQLPRPQNDVVHYAQGARFAVSRDRIQQRSKAFYERLLSLVSIDVDPCLNYLYEYAWYYIVGKPETGPCTMTQDEKTQAWAAKVRLLKGEKMSEQCVSGISWYPWSGSGCPCNSDVSTSWSGSGCMCPCSEPKPAPTPAPAPTKDPSPSPTPAPTPAPAPFPTPAPTPAPAPALAPSEEHYVQGEVVLEVESPEAACMDDALAGAVKNAHAKLAVVGVDAVQLDCTVIGSSSGGRRLGGAIEFGYQIQVASPEAAVAAADKMKTTSLADFAASIKENLPAEYALTVQSLTAEAVVVVITTTTTQKLPEDVDSHAGASAALGSMIMAVIASTLMFSQ